MIKLLIATVLLLAAVDPIMDTAAMDTAITMDMAMVVMEVTGDMVTEVMEDMDTEDMEVMAVDTATVVVTATRPTDTVLMAMDTPPTDMDTDMDTVTEALDTNTRGALIMGSRCT